MSKTHLALSASRIKTLQSCSWIYYCKYNLRLPEATNDGALRGSICHKVFEVLGNPRHKKHYNKAIKKNDPFAVPSIKRMVHSYCAKNEIDDEANVELIREMLLEGLKYDFFGHALGRPSESFDEISFDITKEDDVHSYRIRGFIDKLFLFKKKGIALIRDFKSSKSIFTGKDITDNVQHLMYCLAVKHLYPEFLQRKMNFVFLRFDCDSEGSIHMDDVDDLELKGFEAFLTEIQKLVDNFDENDATANLAYYKGMPKPEDGFSGRIMCGFGKSIGELKKDGTPKWRCPYRDPFDYFVILNTDGNVVSSHFEKSLAKEEAKKLGFRMEKRGYAGCPAFYNKNKFSLDDDVFL